MWYATSLEPVVPAPAAAAAPSTALVARLTVQRYVWRDESSASAARSARSVVARYGSTMSFAHGYSRIGRALV